MSIKVENMRKIYLEGENKYMSEILNISNYRHMFYINISIFNFPYIDMLIE